MGQWRSNSSSDTRRQVVAALALVPLLLLSLIGERHSATLHSEAVPSSSIAMESDCRLDHPPSFEIAEEIAVSPCVGCLLHSKVRSDQLGAGFAGVVPSALGRLAPLSDRPIHRVLRLDTARGPPSASLHS